MTNPAHELAELLVAWRATGNASPEAVRRKHAATLDSTVATQQARAMRAYLELEQWIARLRDAGVGVDQYERMLPRWQDAIFSKRHPWTTAVQRGRSSGVTDDELGMLEALGAQIDTAQNFGRLSEQSVAAVRLTLERGKAFVEKRRSDMRPETALFLAQALSLADRSLEEGDVPSALRALASFTGMLLLLAEQAAQQGDERRAWDFKEQAATFVRDVVSGFTAGAALGAIGM